MSVKHAVELLGRNDVGLRVVAGADNEVWLHFDTAAGVKASINVTVLAAKTAAHGGSVISGGLSLWCNERVEQAALRHDA